MSGMKEHITQRATLCPRCTERYIIPHGSDHRDELIALGVPEAQGAMQDAYTDICPPCRVAQEDRFIQTGLLELTRDWPIAKETA